MNHPEHPPQRLVDHPEWGADWRAIANDALPAARLEAGRAAVLGKIAALSGASAVSAGTAAVGAKVGAATAVTGATSGAVKVGVALLVAGGFTAYGLTQMPSGSTPETVATNGTAPPVLESAFRRPETPQVAITTAPTASVASAEPLVVSGSVRVPSIAATSEAGAVSPIEPETAPVAPETAPSRESLIPAQLTLLEDARALASGGDFDGSLTKLDELEQRFPGSALDPEVRLARAETLVRAERFSEATTALQGLIADPVFASKKATLLQMLGDSWVKRGRCDRAERAYENALAEGLPEEQKAAVRRAMRECATR